MTVLVPTSLAVAYVTFCLLVGLIVPNDSEGSRHVIVSWATDFFVATMLGFMSIRLFFCTSHWRMTSLSFLLQCLTYITKGMTSKSCGETLSPDVQDGETGQFLLTWLYYLLWTGSALLYAFLIHHTLDKAKEMGGLTCGLLESRVLFGMIALAMLVVSTGCLWNMLTLWDPSSDEDVETATIPIAILQYGQLFWHGFYSAFLITAAYVWSALAKQMEISVSGLSHSIATAVVVVSQVCILAILIFYALDIANNSEKLRSDKSHMYATIFYNFATLLSGYFVHSFLLSLFRSPTIGVKEEASTDDDDSADEENPSFVSSVLSSIDEEEDDDESSVHDEESEMDSVDYSDESESDDDEDDYSQDFEIEVNDDGKGDVEIDMRKLSGTRSNMPEELPSGMTSGRVLTYFVGTTAE